jgi:hypothetical protein
VALDSPLITARLRDALKFLLVALLFGERAPFMTRPKVNDLHRSLPSSYGDSLTISAQVFQAVIRDCGCLQNIGRQVKNRAAMRPWPTAKTARQAAAAEGRVTAASQMKRGNNTEE